MARTLGRTLEELGQTMSAAEFGLHLADFQRRPWGDTVVELMGGVVASTIANVNRGKDTQPFRASDFMPLFAHEQEPEPEVRSDGASFFAEVLARQNGRLH